MNHNYPGTPKLTEKKLRYRWFMLAWLMLVCLVIGLATAIIPALFDEIKADLSLTHAQVGIIWGALSFGTLLSAVIGGALGDRLGVKKVIAIGLLGAAVSCGLRAVLTSFWGMTFTMALLGVAAGFIFPNISKAVGMWFPRRRL